MNTPLTWEQLEALRQLDTCTVANAIETFNVRLRDEGFANASIHSIFPRLPTMVGYAATVRIRCSGPPTEGGAYHEHTDWWNHLLTTPAPRVVVIEDVDERAGFGSFLGDVHVNILKALGCVGAVTNGSVRDLPAIEPLNFPLLAGNVAVSRAFVHIVDFGHPVTIGGLTIRPGDLLHGDRHGLLTIPPKIAAGIPAAAAQVLERERKVIALCHSGDFSVDKLRDVVKGVL